MRSICGCAHPAGPDRWQRAWRRSPATRTKSAWTWEHMALTRARAICSDDRLCAAVEGVIRDVLCRPRDADTLLRDVADMRARIDKEHGTEDVWKVKYLRGGLIDIEFIAQYLSAAARPCDAAGAVAEHGGGARPPGRCGRAVSRLRGDADLDAGAVATHPGLSAAHRRGRVSIRPRRRRRSWPGSAGRPSRTRPATWHWRQWKRGCGPAPRHAMGSSARS